MGVSSTAAFVLLGLLPGMGNGTLHDRAPWRYLAPPSIAKIRCTQVALAELRQDKVFPHAIVDDGVGSLMLGSLAPGQYENFLRFTASERAHAAAFIRFTRPPENLATRAAAIGQIFPACTALTGTAIEICRK
jgi:hypothetical protein